MLPDDASGACAHRFCGKHVFVLLDGQNLTAHKTRHADPVQKTEYDEHGYHVGAKLSDDGNTGEIHCFLEYN